MSLFGPICYFGGIQFRRAIKFRISIYIFSRNYKRFVAVCQIRLDLNVGIFCRAGLDKALKDSDANRSRSERAGNINEFFVNDSGDNTLLAQLLSDFDTGIESISSKKTPLEESLSFLSKDSREQVISAVDKTIHDNADLQSSLENGSRKTFGIENRRFVLSLENGNLMAEELMMNHGNASDLFDLRDESDGTQRLFDLIPAYEVVKDGRVVLIDEIDRSFHSKLTEAYVRKFFELTEGNACQMICTTHDLNLLTLNLLRQDEIWFAERTAEHSTQLYSLSEFKTRSDKSILNDYVQGRYGAVPCILENDHEEG